MSDIFNEIDEELRRDKMTAWWKKNAVAIILGCVLAVAGVAGYKFWQNTKLESANEAGSAYYEALKNVQAAGGKTDVLNSLIAAYPDSVGLLAEFTKAQALAHRGDTKDALALYDKISASTKEQTLKNLALVRSGYLLIDTASFKELEVKLGGLNKDANAWRSNAREILGMAAWRAGDMKKAHDLFNLILADRAVAPGIYQRAQFMAALIAPKLK